MEQILSLTYSGSYWYTVSGGDCYDVYYRPDSATPLGLPSPPYVPPVSDFQATNSPDDQGWNIDLNWESAQPEFYIYRMKHIIEGDTIWRYLGSINSTSYTDTFALTGKSYLYRVRAFNEEWISNPVMEWGTALDDLEPSGAPDPSAQTIGDITFVSWDPLPSSLEPNLGGYDVCPYVLGEQQVEDAFILNSSPVVRECYAFEYMEGDDKGLWLGGRVRSIDRSGNVGNWGEPFLAYIPGPGVVKENDASGYNSARRFLRSKEGVLYLAYTNNNQIHFRYNDTRDWSSPQVVGEGKYPAMALHSDNKTASLVWSFNNYNDEYLLYSEMDPVTKTWSEPQVIFNTSNTSYVGVGAPSFVIFDDVAYIVFETAMVGGRSETPLIINGFALVYIKFPLLDPNAYEWVQLDSISFTRVYFNLDDLYTDGGGTSIDNTDRGSYILWDCDGTEMRFYQPAENPENGWLIEVFVGNTGPVYDPYVSVDGNQVYLLWVEGNLGEIYYRYLYTGDKDFISRPLKISNTTNDSRNHVLL